MHGKPAATTSDDGSVSKVRNVVVEFGSWEAFPQYSLGWLPQLAQQPRVTACGTEPELKAADAGEQADYCECRILGVNGCVVHERMFP